jgi:NADPH:quinone reductase-like Zn-dependent oxidoreductase
MQRSGSVIVYFVLTLLGYWIHATTSSSLLLIPCRRRRRGLIFAAVMRRRGSPQSDHPNLSTTTTTPLLTIAADNNISLPTESRGIYFGGFGEPIYERVERVQRPDRNHLLVQVHAVGLNPVDAKGVIGDKLGHNERKTLRKWAHNSLVKNTRVGFDFAGVVVAAHPHNIDDYDPAMMIQVGTRVFGTMPPLQGSCGTYIQVPLHQVARVPSHLSMEEAAALPLVGLTAWQSLSPYIERNESNVLILGGSGGTGHVAIQVAKALGAKEITTLCSTRNMDFCKECGATTVIDYTTITSGSSGSDDTSILHELLLPYGPFDVILDCVTSADPSDAQHDYPSKIRNTTVVSSQHLYQRLGARLSSDWIRAGLARKNYCFPHSWLWKDPRERLFWIRFPHSSHELEELVKLTPAVKPRIQRVYPELTVATVQQAFDDILSRRVKGKVVVRVVPATEEEQAKREQEVE